MKDLLYILHNIWDPKDSEMKMNCLILEPLKQREASLEEHEVFSSWESFWPGY